MKTPGWKYPYELDGECLTGWYVLHKSLDLTEGSQHPYCCYLDNEKINESWDVNYDVGVVLNIAGPFTKEEQGDRFADENDISF